MTTELVITLCIISLILGFGIGTVIGIIATCLMSVAGDADKAMGAK